MPFVQRAIEPKWLSKGRLFDDDGRPKIGDFELEAVTNGTLCNALRQLGSLVRAADDIFAELGGRLEDIGRRSERLKVKIGRVEEKARSFDPKEVAVPESDIASFASLKNHYKAERPFECGLFTPDTRPSALRRLYDTAAKTPVDVMRQLDRWRRDGCRSSRFFVCTPVLGAKRRRVRNKIDIDIETSLPAALEDLRRWTSKEALGDVTVTPDCANRIASTFSEGDVIDHKLPSPEEQLQVVALKFPAEMVAVDVTGRSFDRMSSRRRSLAPETASERADRTADGVDEAAGAAEAARRRPKNRRTRGRRRNTLAGTDQKEIRDAITAGEEPSSSNAHQTDADFNDADAQIAVTRSKSSDLLRSTKKDSPETKKSHFNTLKQWGRSRYDKLMNKHQENNNNIDKMEDVNLYESITARRRRDAEKDRRTHQRNPSISSSEKSIINSPITHPLSNITVRLRDVSTQRRRKDEPHSSSGNWSASSESGRASVGSETHPKSTTSATASTASLNRPGSVNSRRRYNANTPTTSGGSVTSEGTLTPDIIHDLHEDGETSSVYSCDTEGYYTSFHLDSGLKTLKEEEATPPTPLHVTSAISSNTALSAESEYELFGKGSTSTTTSSAGTVCTTLRASDSNKSLMIIGPAVPERKSSLSGKSNESSLERDFGDRTGTVKRSPATNTNKPVVVQTNDGDISPDSGHNTSSSPIESISSPNGVRSGSDFELSESSDMEGPERSERIRAKTTIDSSRIPSMCVITPTHSDDDASDASSTRHKSIHSKPQEASIRHKTKPQEVVNSTRYKSIHSKPQEASTHHKTSLTKPQEASARHETIYTKPQEVVKEAAAVSKPPIIKASLLPLNNMLGRLKSNLASLAQKRDRSKSPNASIFDAGEYVTIADVRNNNQAPAQEDINKNLASVLAGKLREAEYVSLNELPCNTTTKADSLERRRQGARVVLDGDGKVVYSSDSLKRRKGAHTTFEPGKNVKSSTVVDGTSPVLRSPQTVRPVPNTQHQMRANVPPTEFHRPRAQLVVKAAAGAVEVVRRPAATVVAAAKSPPRGAYVNVQSRETEQTSPVMYPYSSELDTNRYIYPRRYSTLPSKKTRYFEEPTPERSVTPDITRGLSRLPAKPAPPVPVQMPDISRLNLLNADPKVSPIEPRHSGGFQSSTPTAKELKAASNLEHRLLSPRKSTMSNEELYAVIHRVKKKMNIDAPEPVEAVVEAVEVPSTRVRSPETGYIGKSPSRGDYVDFTEGFKLSPPKPKPKQTSTLDFKKLLLQKCTSTNSPKKISAVEQLKLSKQQPQGMDILDLSGSPRTFGARKFAPGSPGKAMKTRPHQWRFASPRSDVLSSPIPEAFGEEESPEGSMERRRSGGGSSPKGMPRLNVERAPYTAATQRLYAQRARYFSAPKREGDREQEKVAPPALETAF
ncbi:unnamed protein product [Phyllotreta striolata]|uniref:WASP family protein member n=1 Tax=Phyllotreta striolata TaxID=444603 RepID=A0A9P0DU01_PHYSR|nr:unnamed protein product [Phyllotreta striolata]